MVNPDTPSFHSLHPTCKLNHLGSTKARSGENHLIWRRFALTRIAAESIPFTLLLGVIAGLPALSIDLSAPTLALLPDVLRTTVFVAGLSLSLFILGFGLGQFVGGRGSDHFGRRPTLIVALSTYAFAGLCCAFATSGDGLATARFLQGLAAGGCSVQSYAMIQDLYVGEAARRKQAYVTSVLTLMPMLAPAAGAVILMFFGWRSVHVTMAIGGMLLLLVVSLFVGESRPRQSSGSGGLGIAESMWMLRDSGFRRITIVNALSYASIFAYIAGGPVVMIAQLGYGNAVYVAVFAATAASLSAGAMASASLAHRFEASRLIWPALLCQAIANAGLVVAALALRSVGPLFMLPLLFAGCFARGIMSPNLIHAALSPHRERAGLAAALVGLAQLVTAAISSAVLARLLQEFSVVSVAAVMACLSAGAVIVWSATGLGRLIAERS